MRNPKAAQEAYKDKMPIFPAKLDADISFVCKGDCMTGAGLKDGDIVYISYTAPIKNGDIVAAIVDDEPLLKQYYREADTLMLIPCNPKYRPLTFTGTESDNVTILGKAVGYTTLF